MATSPTTPTGAPAAQGERRFVLSDVPWWTYVALRDALDEEASGVRMTYLDGDLELMSPSELHEDAKTILARLLEAWAVEKNVDLRGFGSTTFRREANRGGLEPDECYKLGPLEGSVPDIAVEIVVTKPDLDKLEVYRRLGVREVWLWEDGALSVHVLGRDRYELRSSSAVLPDLDVAHLASYVRPGESQTSLVRAYRASLVGARRGRQRAPKARSKRRSKR